MQTQDTPVRMKGRAFFKLLKSLLVKYPDFLPLATNGNYIFFLESQDAFQWNWKTWLCPSLVHCGESVSLSSFICRRHLTAYIRMLQDMTAHRFTEVYLLSWAQKMLEKWTCQKTFLLLWQRHTSSNNCEKVLEKMPFFLPLSLQTAHHQSRLLLTQALHPSLIFFQEPYHVDVVSIWKLTNIVFKATQLTSFPTMNNMMGL